MSSVRIVYAPAKINLCLHVQGKRSDGYHDLGMIMQRVSLYDRLKILLEPKQGVRVDCPGLKLEEGEVNIVEKSAHMFLEYVGARQGVSIAVEKHIPSAAGLGGGSSDAAVVLETLNDMLGTKLSCAELMSLGTRLGADVPFFLYKKTAWATGIGNRFQVWPGLPPLSLVLINPRVPISTAKIFQNLGLTHRGTVARIPRFPVGTSDLLHLLHNDLEDVTCQRYPVITTIKERLIANGSKGALMSGSGATVFGLFDDELLAKQAAQTISKETEWWVKTVNPL